MFRRCGVGAGEEDPELRFLGPRRPDLLAGDDPLVAVEHGPGGERGEVTPGLGLAEQLAPELVAREHRAEVPLLLLLGAGEQQGGTGPADADLVVDGTDAGAVEFLVDDQLVFGVRIEAPGPGPVRCGVAGVGEFDGRGIGMGAHPRSHGQAARVVVDGQLEVHGRTLRHPVGRESAELLPHCQAHGDDGGGPTGSAGVGVGCPRRLDAVAVAVPPLVVVG